VEKITIGRFGFSLKPLEPILLPAYKGSTLRGGFGHAFKRVVCALKKNDCAECILKEKCVYSYVFETPPPSDTTIMRKYTSVPHPFIIEPPLETKRVYKPGDNIEFGLTLIGRAADYLPYFIYSFSELGNIGIGKGKGKYELKTVRDVSGKISGKDEIIYDSELKTVRDVSGKISGKDEIIYDSESKTLKSFNPGALSISFPLLTSPHFHLSLLFLTPTRIVYDSHLTLDLEFHMLIRQLLRRLSLLSYFHCGIDTSDWNFKGIIEKAEAVKVKERKLRWHDWEKYSARQDTKMKMGGFMGSITFEGDLKPFMPLIKAGEVLHVGKGTGFGLGRYGIVKDDSG